MSQPKLFQPIQVGRLALQHRVVLAPLTRLKSGRTDHIPTAPGGRANLPGIWSQPQIDAWKQITDAVHDKGSYIFLQIRALGRTADPDMLTAEDPSFPFISASNIKLTGHPDSEPAPRALTLPEIDEYVALHAQAARNAIEAGFDGDVSNVRDDEYGGSVENRSRFALRVVDAVVDAVGADRTGLRLSPWSSFLNMGMSDPLPQFTHLISTLARTHTDLAYIHLVEPRIAGNADRTPAPGESNASFRAAWAPRPIISAGGYDRAAALAAAEAESNVLVAFGRYYISNPDLPKRLQKDTPLTPYDRKTFYVPVDKPGAEHGYVDYPFAEEDGRL
ncbi:hypothetical protein BD779DRAFT_1671110 [Infundibulicybe gibba]|nr:hypothetical protein BD779DRAFT_1671110 [Infundibulicybe gibba]